MYLGTLNFNKEQAPYQDISGHEVYVGVGARKLKRHRVHKRGGQPRVTARRECSHEMQNYMCSCSPHPWTGAASKSTLRAARCSSASNSLSCEPPLLLAPVAVADDGVAAAAEDGTTDGTGGADAGAEACLLDNAPPPTLERGKDGAAPESAVSEITITSVSSSAGPREVAAGNAAEARLRFIPEALRGEASSFESVPAVVA
jgi:hypothetical protein